MAKFSLIDAFITQDSFSGNPACVVLGATGVSDEWMQSVASEMNQAETAFLSERSDGSYDLRWFTPSVEVDLCGHATLASAHFLRQLERKGPYNFHTKSGLLVCEFVSQESLELDFPALPVTASEDVSLAKMFPKAKFRGTLGMDWFVEVEPGEVETFSPDMVQIAHLGLRGLILCSAGKKYDLVSRFFAPQSGVDEDAATGSAHCALAPYFAKKLGRSVLSAYQASSRGAKLGIQVCGDRVKLQGMCRTVVDGDLVMRLGIEDCNPGEF